MNTQQLEDRLIDFAVSAIKVAESAGSAMLGKVLANELKRSSTSLALNYAESQGAKSRRDFRCQQINLIS